MEGDALREAYQGWLSTAGLDEPAILAADLADIREVLEALGSWLETLLVQRPDEEEFLGTLHEMHAHVGHLIWHWTSLATRTGQLELLLTPVGPEDVR